MFSFTVIHLGFSMYVRLWVPVVMGVRLKRRTDYAKYFVTE